ncbi:MAG: hypothetical protein K6T83_15445 [Alicyclobacillus sp.]|nr:hypothetical protein [Alicyclobacillus sp.]
MSFHHLLDVDLIDSVMREFAMTVRWYPAHRCSCWGNITGQPLATGSPDPMCPICHGLGRYYDEYESVTGVVLDGMQNIATFDDSTGVNYQGVIRMTVPVRDINGQPIRLYFDGALNDMILAEDIVLHTRTVVKRGLDQTREYPIGPVQIHYGETQYQQNVDYRVEGKNIIWLTSGPPQNASYEAIYSYHPWFTIIHGMAITRNVSHLNLPRTYVLQLSPEYGESYAGQ